MTLTIEIPEEIALRLRDAAARDGREIGAFAIAAIAETVMGDVDPETVASLRTAMDDIRAGRLLTLEEADASFDADFAEARRRFRQNTAPSHGGQ